MLPGTFLCVYLVGKCGRKVTIAGSHVLTAMCFLAILAVPKGHFPHDWPRVAAAAVGIVALSVSTIYPHYIYLISSSISVSSQFTSTFVVSSVIKLIWQFVKIPCY